MKEPKVTVEVKCDIDADEDTDAESVESDLI